MRRTPWNVVIALAAALLGACSPTAAPTKGAQNDGEALCEAACASTNACSEFPDERCVDSCLENMLAYGYIGRACAQQYEGYLQCESEASCEEMAGSPAACEDELAAVEASESCELPVCVEYCDRVSACGLGVGQEAECRQQCSWQIGWSYVAHGVECSRATEAVYSCSMALDCAQIEQGGGCQAEVDALRAACPWEVDE